MLVIGEAAEKLGVMSLAAAIRLAQEHGTDLAEVAPTAVPPVCRLLDYGKYKYEQDKRHRQARQGQHEMALREVRMRPKVAEHDLQFKARLVRKLLGEGDKVKLSVMFRGREIAHPDIGRGLVERVLREVKDTGSVERTLAMEGRSMSVILAPSKQLKAAQASRETDAKTQDSQGS